MLRTAAHLLSLLVLVGGVLAAPAASASTEERSTGALAPRDPRVVDRGVGTVTLAWREPVETAAVTDYRVEYAAQPGAWTVFDDGVSRTTSAVVSGLATGTWYWFRVTALAEGRVSDPVPVRAAAPSTTSADIGLGNGHTCLVGSDRLTRCWGRGRPVSGDLMSGVEDVVDVSAGDGYECALTAAGAVYCRGINHGGALGTGPSGPNTSWPVRVSGVTDAVAVDAGSSHACALRATREVVCWGFNLYGQVGTGGTSQGTYPTQVAGLADVVAVSAGGSATCAVLATGGVRCWGHNGYGQVGDGTKENRYSPTDVAGIGSAIDVAVGSGSTCALLAEGHVSCWGNVFDDSGAQDVFPHSLTPVPVPDLDDARALANGSSGCVLRDAGTVSCWGWNGQGQLGDGTTEPSDVPVRMGNFANAVAVDVYYEHACALLDTGSVRCYGVADDLPSADQVTNAPVAPAGPPADINNIRVTDRTSSSVGIAWEPADPDATPVTGYLVQVHGLAGWVTVAELNESTRSYTTTGLSEATSYRVRVLAQSAAGPSGGTGTWVGTTGTGTTRVTVTGGGEPVVGGAVTWQTADGDFRSSQAYGLTANGVVDLQRTPAAGGVVKLVDGVLPSGARVSGKWQVQLRSGGLELTTPDAPATGRANVRTLVPGGGPIAGAEVTVSGLVSTTTVDGFTFHAPPGTVSGRTDDEGLFTASGYPSGGPPTATAVYDDGVLWQRVRDVPLQGESTDVTFSEMPWLDLADETMTASEDDTVKVPVQVESGATSAGLAWAAGFSETARVGASGVEVRIVPPSGAKQTRCNSKLSGTSDRSGSVTLRVCATKSGVYKIKGQGAAATSWLMLKVRGAPPLQPTSASGVSPRLGQARVAWNPPSYTGGARVRYYTVKLVGGGETRVKKVDADSARVATWKGLEHATTYRAVITATTRHGTSGPVRTQVPVA